MVDEMIVKLGQVKLGAAFDVKMLLNPNVLMLILILVFYHFSTIVGDSTG